MQYTPFNPETDDSENAPKVVTLEDVQNFAWETGEKSLNRWKQTLENFTQENAGAINQHLANLSVLYGKPIPTAPYTLSLHHMPDVNSTKGEPTKNFEHSPEVRAMGDVFLWLPKDEAPQPQRLQRITKMILHEMQHQSFQAEGEKHKEMLSYFETQRPRIRQLREQIKLHPNFIHSFYENEAFETTNEMLTSYVESTIDFSQSTTDATKLAVPLIFKVDELDHAKLLETIRDADTQERWNGNSPYTRLVQGWRDAINTAQNNEQKKTPENSTKVQPLIENQTPKVEYNKYSLGRALPPTLVQEYVSQGKPIDAEFVERLYEMALKKLGEEAN